MVEPLPAPGRKWHAGGLTTAASPAQPAAPTLPGCTEGPHFLQAVHQTSLVDVPQSPLITSRIRSSAAVSSRADPAWGRESQSKTAGPGARPWACCWRDKTPNHFARPCGQAGGSQHPGSLGERTSLQQGSGLCSAAPPQGPHVQSSSCTSSAHKFNLSFHRATGQLLETVSWIWGFLF